MLTEITTFVGLLIYSSLASLLASFFLWGVFGKWLPKMLYGSLFVLGLSLYIWILSNLLIDGIHIAPPEYTYETNLPFPKLMKAIFVTGLFVAVYSMIALITALARHKLQRSCRQLIFYSVWALAVCSLIVFWQLAAPCEITFLGCKISNWPSLVPTAPTNI